MFLFQNTSKTFQNYTLEGFLMMKIILTFLLTFLSFNTLSKHFDKILKKKKIIKRNILINPFIGIFNKKYT